MGKMEKKLETTMYSSFLVRISLLLERFQGGHVHIWLYMEFG